MGIGKLLKVRIGTWFKIFLKDAMIKRRIYTEILVKNLEVQGVKAG